MRKSKILNILAFALSCIVLSSCYFFNPEFYLVSSQDNTEAINKKIDFKKGDYSSSFSEENMTLSNIGEGRFSHYLPSKGKDKLLVIPIETTDYAFSTYELTALNQAFFGSISWESVASYYNKSSYNQLSISGIVTSKVRLNITSAQLQTNYDNYSENNENYTDYILNAALKALDSEIDYSEYDVDNNGYIDAVWMVYACPYSDVSNVFWAYTTWSENTDSYDGKKASTYAWASKDFMGLNSFISSPDAHTYIHETGHMLGLDDYYSYDYAYDTRLRTGNSDTPVGGVDMMDVNIGDHMAFSKYLLDWIKPTVITPEYLSANNNKITLNSLTDYSSHNALLLPIYKEDNINYNNTVFDEYLLIEYYTPTNLNKQDTDGYKGLGTYTTRGVLVYHVDARIGKIVASRNSSLVWNGYVFDKLPSAKKDLGWGNNYMYTFIYNNTRSDCYEKNMSDENLSFYRGRLVSLLPSTGRRIEGNRTGYSNNSSLYKTGKAFNKSVYSTFKFDDGSAPKYGFVVSSTTDVDCTLEFSEF